LAKALADVEAADADQNELREILRELVAVTVKAGMSPDKIYAVIKTGRIRTTENMKFLQGRNSGMARSHTRIRRVGK
jgi:hypothetical protein